MDDDAFFLEEPFAGYNRNNITIRPPRPDFEENLRTIGHSGEIMYCYGPNRSNSAPLRIKFPKLVCLSGLEAEKFQHKRTCSECGQIKPHQIKGNPIEILRMVCELSPLNPIHQKLREILMDVYRICVEYMEVYGSSKWGRGNFRETFVMGDCPDKNDIEWKTRLWDHLRSPVVFGLKTIRTEGSTHTDIDLDAPMYLDLSAKGVESDHRQFEMSPVVTLKLFVTSNSFIELFVEDLRVSSYLPQQGETEAVTTFYSEYHSIEESHKGILESRHASFVSGWNYEEASR